MARTLSTSEYRRLCCPVCKALREACYCARLSRTRSPLKLFVVQHSKERYSQSNTGNLLGRVFAESKLLSFGGQDAPFNPSPILNTAFDPLVLFPLADQPVISPADLETTENRKPALIVLDATWRQARRMLTRIAGLGALRFRRLPEEAAPSWRLRQPTGPGQLCTADAVAWALWHLGFPAAAQSVWDALGTVASHVLSVRGRAAGK